MFALRSAATSRTLAAASVLLLVAACSSSAPAASTGSSAGTASSTPSSGSSGAPAASSGGGPSASAGASVGAGPSGSLTAGAGTTLSLEAKEYGFQGPVSATAGVTTISLRNTGKEEHQAQLVKLNEGKSFSDLTAALGSGDPAAALAIVSVSGGPTGVQPGATGEATENLAPGNYAFLCFISGADGIPHVAKGMVSPLTVTGTAADAPLPTGDATVTAKDFTYDVTGPVAPGQHTFTLTNNGPQPHEAGIIKLTGAMTVDQIKAVFTASPAPSQAPGPPPWQDVGGSAAIAPGSTGTFTANLEAGQQYAFICFVPDPASGKPHAQLGMITAIPTP